MADTEIVLKEIPVQILSLNKGDVIVLRVQAGTPRDYQRQIVNQMYMALIAAKKDAVVTVLEDDVDLAVVKADS